MLRTFFPDGIYEVPKRATHRTLSTARFLGKQDRDVFEALDPTMQIIVGPLLGTRVEACVSTHHIGERVGVLFGQAITP